MPVIGEINEKGSVIEWSLKDFLSLTDKRYDSPKFSYGNESWYFSIIPSINKYNGYIVVHLYRESYDPPIRKEFIFGIKTADGMLAFERHLTHTFVCGWYKGVTQWISRSELFERKSDLLPSGALTLVLEMKDPESDKFSSLSNTVTTKCSYCNKNLGNKEDIQCHLRKCEEFPINCPKCSDDVALKNWFDHKCQIIDERDDSVAVCQDLNKMLLNGINHDLILKVGDKKLCAHQDVLRAQSRVFESMLNHDTTEKKNGVLDIPDCDPQAMELFLSYVYSGKIDALDQNNMLGLYYIADKYDMQSLKQHCCNFIKKSLSHTNICEVIKLALNHTDTSLLEYATEYFMDNADDIMVTVEWQSFLKDNFTAGNELMLKSFKRMKEMLKKDNKN